MTATTTGETVLQGVGQRNRRAVQRRDGRKSIQQRRQALLGLDDFLGGSSKQRFEEFRQSRGMPLFDGLWSDCRTAKRGHLRELFVAGLWFGEESEDEGLSERGGGELALPLHDRMILGHFLGHLPK